MAELIDRQQGDTFTQKFENLVSRCVWELPAKERELAALEERIREKRDLLLKLSTQAGELHMTISDLASKTESLKRSIDQAVKKWDT